LSRGAGGATGTVYAIRYSVHPWQNAANPADVDGLGGVFPLDALVVINDLNANGPRALPIPPPTADRPPPYLDVSGDDHVSPIDALIVINTLNRR
jgi:hypothetical protein